MNPPTKGIWKIITASSVGTLIEWYDFYIFGSLAPIIGKQLFPSDTGASALINTLAIFAAGFVVRPFGALVFGRLGDKIGRKYTFLLTLILMGGSTFAIGLVPGFSRIGYAAPVLVLLLRLIQGLALGGEYGGAATYVAEHSPLHKRGFYTSWIQTTATLGLFLSLGIIVFTRTYMGTEKFESWGWRIPFWISILLVLVSIYIRLKMRESPLYSKIKAEGTVSTNPLKESFRHKANFKMVLLALFGAVMGQGVIWYTGQFYAQSFLENTCKIEFNESRYILLWAILFATPFFVFFGWLSDKVGRKWIILAGMFLGIISYRPIYQTFLNDTDAKQWMKALPDPRPDPNLNIDRIDQKKTDNWISFLNSGNKITIVPKKVDTSLTRDTMIYHYANHWSLKTGLKFDENRTDSFFTSKNFSDVHPDSINIHYDPSPTFTEKILPPGLKWKFVLLVFFQIIFVTMVYGPIAAFLVELFPTRIRYTSMSLPYHIGNGVFGGLVPFIATLITSFKGTTPLSGLWYPIGVASVCFIIGLVYIQNRGHQIKED
jgi:MFS family permease